MFYKIESEDIYSADVIESRLIDLDSIAEITPPDQHTACGSQDRKYWSFTIYFKYRRDYMSLTYKDERGCLSAYKSLMDAIRDTAGIYEPKRDDEGLVTPYDPDSGEAAVHRLGLTANNVEELLAYANKTTDLLIGDHAVIDVGSIFDVMPIVLEALQGLSPKELTKVQKTITGRYWIC